MPFRSRAVAAVAVLALGATGCASMPPSGAGGSSPAESGDTGGTAGEFVAGRVGQVSDGRPAAEGALTLVRTGPSRGRDASEDAAAEDAVAAVAEDAVRRVETLWDEAPTPAHPVLVVLAGSESDYEELTGTTGGPGATVTPPEAGGESAVVLHPDAVERLTTEGLRALLAHELAHVAQRGVPGDAPVPLWLSEGLAEYTALGGDPDTVRRLAAEVEVDDVPADERVRADARAGRGYAASWTLVAMLADTAPDRADAVARLYAQVRGGASLQQALADHAGLTPEGLPDRWRAWLEATRAGG